MFAKKSTQVRRDDYDKQLQHIFINPEMSDELIFITYIIWGVERYGSSMSLQ